jgi:SAM-dependent methyltransferase
MKCQPAQVNDWFKTDLGQRLLDAEITVLRKILPHLFGYHLVQMGGVGEERLIASSRIVHRCLLNHAEVIHPHKAFSQVSVEIEALPLTQDCIDVVVLPHVLEFERHPYAILQEIERVLIPEGHLVIIGFNLFSLWGVWQHLSIRRRTVPWCGNFLSLLRLRDWLAVLGFSLEEEHTFFFLPPINNKRIANYTIFLEKLGSCLAWKFGAIYVVVAKKRVATLTPLRPKWHSTNAVLTVPKTS